MQTYEIPEVEIKIGESERVYLSMMIDNLNKMCGTGERPTLEQLQVIRDTVEHWRYTILSGTPLDYRIIP